MKNLIIKLLIISSSALLVLGVASACKSKDCDHNYIEHIVEATCTEDGYSYFKCDLCGDSYVEEGSEVAAKGHTPEVLHGSEPTCAQFGYTDGTKCSVCNEVLEEQVQIPKLEHNNIIKSIVEPTCLTGGYTVYLCTECEAETNGDYVSALEHVIVTEYGVKPTCTENGTTDKTYCSRCNTVFTEHTTLPAINHSYGSWVVTEIPTAQSSGTAVRTCENDVTHRETVILPVLNKIDYIYSVTKKAECEAEGNEQYSYVKDGKNINVNISLPVLGHSFGNWVLSVKPTFSSTGTLVKSCLNNSAHIETFILPMLNTIDYSYTLVSTSTCSVPGTERYIFEKDGQSFEITSELPLLAHKVVEDPAVAATCISTGLTAGSHCYDCNKVIVAQNVIPVSGHTPVVTRDGSVATCTEQGLKEQINCAVCNIVIQSAEPIPALGHIDADNNDTCDRCGTMYGKNVKEIYTVSDLQSIASNLSGKYILKNNINLTGVTWTPLGTFTGILDGDGYTISNLNITKDTNNANVGFFDTVNNAVIRNIKFQNVYIYVTIPGISNTTVYAGTLAGNAKGASTSITNVEIVSGSVTALKTQNNIFGSSNGEASCGGFFGQASDNIYIGNCINRASVKAEKGSARAGGFIGVCGVVRVENCTNYGAVTASATTVGGYDYAGGIVGKCNDKVSSVFNFCKNNGTLSTLGGSDINKYSGEIFSNG